MCVELRNIARIISDASSAKRLFLLSGALLLFVVNDAIINPSNFENTVTYNMSVVVRRRRRFAQSCARDKRYSHKRCHLLCDGKSVYLVWCGECRVCERVRASVLSVGLFAYHQMRTPNKRVFPLHFHPCIVYFKATIGYFRPLCIFLLFTCKSQNECPFTRQLVCFPPIAILLCKSPLNSAESLFTLFDFRAGDKYIDDVNYFAWNWLLEFNSPSKRLVYILKALLGLSCLCVGCVLFQ